WSRHHRSASSSYSRRTLRISRRSERSELRSAASGSSTHAPDQPPERAKRASVGCIRKFDASFLGDLASSESQQQAQRGVHRFGVFETLRHIRIEEDNVGAPPIGLMMFPADAAREVVLVAEIVSITR